MRYALLSLAALTATLVGCESCPNLSLADRDIRPVASLDRSTLDYSNSNSSTTLGLFQDELASNPHAALPH